MSELEHSEIPFVGIISTVTPDGRCGIVKLGAPCGGFGLAIIGNDTVGRVTLMNATGSLVAGTDVSGFGRPGVDALLAIVVSATAPLPSPMKRTGDA